MSTPIEASLPTTLSLSVSHQLKTTAKHYLAMIALFLSEESLTMQLLQVIYLMSTKLYTEKQVGLLLVIFGVSKFIFQTPAGYIIDSSSSRAKIYLLSIAAILTSFITVVTAITATDYGNNIIFIMMLKFIQGGAMSLIPPGLNSITQGIVGTQGMTSQVSRNEIFNHIGTAVIVGIGSLLAYAFYGNPKWVALIFMGSPLSCLGVLCYLFSLREEDIDPDLARGLIKETSTDTMNYEPPNIDVSSHEDTTIVHANQKATTPVIEVIQNPILLTFMIILFFFHLANAAVLPLVMQTFANEQNRSSISLGGICVIVSQCVMIGSAKVCGIYSGKYGRKPLFCIGLAALPFRCVLLVILLYIRGDEPSFWSDFMMLSTQILDGIGAGIFGIMYILVTSDISAGTGRFSFMLGVTTASVSIGGTISNYVGENLAQDLGYLQCFTVIGLVGCIPVGLYLMFMPETLSVIENREGDNRVIEEEQGNNGLFA